MSIVLIILGLISTIILHELGHYSVARLYNTGIQSFSIGFGKPALKWRNKRGTLWKITPWLFGGYVEMLQETHPTIKGTPYPQQAVYKRACIILAGPLMNILFAWLLITTALCLNLKHPKAIIGNVLEHSIAEQAQLRSNDQIIEIDGETAETWPNTAQALILRLGESKTVPLLIKRQSILLQTFINLENWKLDPLKPNLLLSLGIEPKRQVVPPIINSVKANSPADTARLQKGDYITAYKLSKSKDWVAVTDGRDLISWIKINPKQTIALRVKRHDEFFVRFMELANEGWLTPTGTLGIQLKSIKPDPGLRQPVKPNHEAAAIAAFNHLTQTLSFQGQTLAMLLTGDLSPASLGGPATLVQFSLSAIQQGLAQFFYFLAIFNCMIALINLLPLPILDGGQLIILGLEKVRRRPLSPRFEQLFYHISLILLALIMMQALINDGLRLLSQ